MYIHQLEDWPRFTWRQEQLAGLLAEARHLQGKLLGRMEGLGYSLQDEAVLQTLTQDVVKSSEIEGEKLPLEEVRSSLARRLGLDAGGLPKAGRDVEGVVEMMLDATQNYSQPLSPERLFGWHASLFPAERSGMRRIVTGAWRTSDRGAMQVVSGPVGREQVHYEAPDAGRIPSEMERFIQWFNREDGMDLILRSALAHFWFVTLHPFEDGNGRMARALADMMAARSEKSPHRFYSMSAQIREERREYYTILERVQKGSLDITPWFEWFLGCYRRAVIASESILERVFLKASFWKEHGDKPFHDRQRKVINLLLDDFKGNMTSSKYAKIVKCSQDTAQRDIADLLERGILKKNKSGGRSTSYRM